MKRMMRMTLLVASVAALGCSSDSPRGLRVGMDEPSAGASARGGSGGIDNPGAGTSGGIDFSDNALEVAIEHEGLAVELVTLRCAGDCAEVEAVASGGNDPYTFAWDDGSSDPVRVLCPDQTTSFAVEVTDTSVDTEENPYEAHSARAEVTAEVLRCGDDAGMPPIESDCGPGSTGPVLLVARRESALTGAYTPEHGTQDAYIGGIGTSMPLAIVALGEHPIRLGTCSELLLAANAEGTAPPGWDDTLIIEYGAALDGPVDKRWFYGTVSPITYVPTGEQLTSAADATIAGWDLDPAVPNPLPFGYAPLAIDLMDQAPSAAKDFALTVRVLDTGGFGSTTDVWAIPH